MPGPHNRRWSSVMLGALGCMMFFFRRIAHRVSGFVDFSLVTSHLRCTTAVGASLSRFVLDVLVRLGHTRTVCRLRGLLLSLFLSFAISAISLRNLHPSIARSLRGPGICERANWQSECPQ